MATVLDLQRQVRGLNNRVVLLGVICAVQVATILVISTMVKFGQPERILVPTLPADVYLGGSRPSEQYLEFLTRDVAQLYLNRHPNNTSYFRDGVLRVVDPARQGEFRAAMDEVEARSVQSQAATTFFPQDIFVDPSKNYSEVGGILETYIGAQKVQSQQKRYKLFWVRRGQAVFLDSISETADADAPGAKAQFSDDATTAAKGGGQ
jgi:conjugal transfer pilus assembly protein TraE